MVDYLKEDAMTKKRVVLAGMAILGVLLLAGCAAGINPTVDVPGVEGELAGFWKGLWHGLISCVTFVISLFTDNVNVYEVHNSGNLYDFGFMLGVSIIFGGTSRATKRKRK